jgi:adenosylmethionine-8-amino-7-oxononanoate aminotransferase
VIAFVAETIGGATAGVLRPTSGYFKAMRAVCDKYGVLLILDEVMCGMGGTVDGRKGDHVLLAPPFIATQNELHEIAARLRTAIDQVISEV